MSTSSVLTAFSGRSLIYSRKRASLVLQTEARTRTLLPRACRPRKDDGDREAAVIDDIVLLTMIIQMAIGRLPVWMMGAVMMEVVEAAIMSGCW